MKIGRFVARAVIGGLFVGHGTQKLFGWFGGPGMGGTEQMMGALRMHPTHRNAIAAGASETVGGALLVAGLATPLAAGTLIGTMTTAIRKVHLKNGLWVANGGYEYNLVLIAALVALVDSGPGEISLDAVLGIDDAGLRWAVTSLLAGLTASALAVELGQRNAPAQLDYAPDEPSTAGDPVTQDTQQA